MSFFYENVKKTIDKVDIVSFDIFDTLLLRPYLSPRDLFLQIEIENKVSGFAVARREAELMARKHNKLKEEITFNDIYEQIESKFQKFKDIELEWESKVLKQNAEMKMIWDHAKLKGKKIIITSDMYLPIAFLSQILLKNGFGDFDHLYISGEHGKTKKKGSLFKHILCELDIKPNQMMHIGDNKHGDFKTPKKIGIVAILYVQVIHQFLHAHKNLKVFLSQEHKKLGSSILLSLLAWRWQKKQLGLLSSNYWEDLGYGYAGPLAYGYARWIEQRAIRNNIDHLLFVARDGYLLQKIFATFNSGIKSDYIYAPRFLNLICRLDYDKQQINQSRAIIDYYISKYSELAEIAEHQKLRDWLDCHQFIQKHKDIFQKYADHEFLNYQKYIQQIVGNHQNIGMVDTKTIAFTAQKLLEDVLKIQIEGFYWSTILPYKTHQYAFEEFLPNNSGSYDTNIFTKNWKFVEFLLSSPEYPIKSISKDKSPVFDSDPTFDEKIAKKYYVDIAQGAESFNTDIRGIFGDSNIYLENYSLVSWVNNFCDNPSIEDIHQMSIIKQATDITHYIYNPLFSVEIPFSYVLMHPIKTIQLIKKSKWRSIWQVLIINFLKPIKIKKQGSNILKIVFFPYLKKQYLVISFSPLYKGEYKFIIGNIDKN